MANSAVDRTDCRLESQPKTLLTQRRKGPQKRSTHSRMQIPPSVFAGRLARQVLLVEY